MLILIGLVSHGLSVWGHYFLHAYSYICLSHFHHITLFTLQPDQAEACLGCRVLLGNDKVYVCNTLWDIKRMPVLTNSILIWVLWGLVADLGGGLKRKEGQSVSCVTNRIGMADRSQEEFEYWDHSAQ